ncbi:hypothetical protein PT974_01188 [Cladobotryum mycophilum]|uniref:C2 NT-type domain-containing protein n=1 Tax=Cladobotryum mycophilum TaxID=491253 RepID=A0ABR0T436_9HYPO
MVMLTNMYFFPSVGKARKPRFELHLKIHDLNNVPLVSGNSYIKWHLPHSMTAEHRGRTGKCPIANHRVEYSFSKVIPSVRMSIDRSNNLTECPLEFEILQEFGVTEKITLGFVRLNLAEYVEESESMFRDVTSPPPIRRRANSIGVSPTNTTAGPKVSDDHNRDPEDGIVRRYLIQDSKINSTLKISILLIQVDGDRNYIAPPLKTAPVFGGIAGFMAPEQIEDETGPLPNLAKNRDVAEVQDLYRKTLAASWSRQPAELPADECIEDIFSGGNGWKTKVVAGRSSSAPHPSTLDTDDDFDDADGHHGTLRASDLRRTPLHHRRTHSNSSNPFRYLHHHHRRTPSGSSDKSVSTVTGIPGSMRSPFKRGGPRLPREDSRDDDLTSMRSVGSIASLAPTTGSSERERSEGVKRAKEIGEDEVRDDLVCWSLPSGLTAF